MCLESLDGDSMRQSRYYAPKQQPQHWTVTDRQVGQHPFQRVDLPPSLANINAPDALKTVQWVVGRFCCPRSETDGHGCHQTLPPMAKIPFSICGIDIFRDCIVEYAQITGINSRRRCVLFPRSRRLPPCWINICVIFCHISSAAAALLSSASPTGQAT